MTTVEHGATNALAAFEMLLEEMQADIKEASRVVDSANAVQDFRRV